jgi:pSer/pThr/pTyr-binding forkhead associated (FHA) protein
MKLSLVVLSEGKASGKAIPITLSQFIIGRDPQCQLRPSSPVISKRHCALIIRSGKCYLRDFDSTNGTFLNDEAVKGEREIKNDDLLKIGPLAFKVAIEGSLAVNKPTPLPKALDKPGSDDESVAAMLLDLADEGGTPASGGKAEGVPDGTTVMDLPIPLPPPGAEEEKKPVAAKAEGKSAEKKKEIGNTSAAAEAILAKYRRTTRS